MANGLPRDRAKFPRFLAAGNNAQCVANAAVEDADMSGLFSAAPHCYPGVILYPIMHLTKLNLRHVYESERLIFYGPLGRILRQD